MSMELLLIYESNRSSDFTSAILVQPSTFKVKCSTFVLSFALLRLLINYNLEYKLNDKGDLDP